MFVQSWEVIVAKQDAQLFFFQRRRQLTQAMVCQLWCRRTQKLLSHKRYNISNSDDGDDNTASVVTTTT